MRISTKSIIEIAERNPEFIQGLSLNQIRSRMEGSKLDLTIESVHEISRQNYESFIGKETRITPSTKELEARLFPKLSKLPKDKKGWSLYEGYYLLRTAETISLPCWMSATVHERTTLFKSGVIVSCTSVDPGFDGQLIAGLYVPDTTVFTLEEDARFLCVEFEPIVEMILPGFIEDAPAGFRLSTNPDDNSVYKGIWGGSKVSTQGQEERAH